MRLPQHGSRQITFVDLATHSSGLPLRPQNLASQTALNKYAGYTVEQLYQGLATFELPRDPGTAFEYSNWGFGLLGTALAHCAGKSYESLLAERVTGPLGMHDTTFGPTGDTRGRLAAAYDAKLQSVPNEGLGALNGSGGLYSTVNDMLRFVELFVGRGPRSLTPAGATMLEPLRPGDGPDTRMGLGWRVTTSKGVSTMWSSGRADGYRAFMGFDPVARVAVVALTNAATDVGVDDIGWHVLDPSQPFIKIHPRIAVPAYSCVGARPLRAAQRLALVQQLGRRLEVLVLEQAADQRVARIFVVVGSPARGLGPRQQHPALDVDQRRRHHQELAGEVEIELLHQRPGSRGTAR